MNLPDLCPSCLTELPDGYPYDHVAIDLTLSTQPWRYRHMSHDDRGAVITTGLAAGRTIGQLAIHLNRSVTDLRTVLTAQQLADVDHDRDTFHNQIRALWQQGLSDGDIAVRVGRPVGTVANVRKNKLGLATLYGPGGRRVKAKASA